MRTGRPGRSPAGVALVAAVIAFVLVLGVAAPAQGGAFRVSQCNAVDEGGLAPRGYQAGLWWVGNGWPISTCGAWEGRLAFDTANHRLLHNWDTSAWFALPGSMPRTTLRTAWLDWRSLPPLPGANPSYVIISAAGTRLIEGPSGSGTQAGAAQRRVLPAGARAIQFATWCSPANGPGWCNWPGPLFELRGMTLELEEGEEPGLEMGGALLGPGEHAGAEPVELRATDGDSGVRRVALTLGGVPVGSVDLGSQCVDDRLPPCPPTVRRIVDVDTAQAPDGVRRLRVTVTDAAGNQRTVDAGSVLVRNQPARVDTGAPPSPAPAPAPPPATASPAPSPAQPAGPPRGFPRNPLAGRGHVPNGRNASERARVRAWLEDGRRRRSMVTAPRAIRVRVRGRVTDEEGRPVADASLVLVERIPGGRWRVATGVRTRRDGRFTTFTRIGRSRTLRFVYYPFGDSRRGIRSPDLLRVVGPRGHRG